MRFSAYFIYNGVMKREQAEIIKGYLRGIWSFAWPHVPSDPNRALPLEIIAIECFIGVDGSRSGCRFLSPCNRSKVACRR